MKYLPLFLIFATIISMMNCEATQKRFLKKVEKAKDAMAELKKIAKEDYIKFVEDLSKLVSKDKAGVQNAIKEFAKKNKVLLPKQNIDVTKLMPTQNEIDIDGSICFPLGVNKKDPSKNGDMATLESYLKCDKGVVSVAKKDIIAYKNPKNEFYVVDGHHRWSQLYFINPNCAISALTMQGLKDPFSALKSAQLSVASNNGEVSTADVNGKNLLIVKKEVLKPIIKDYIKSWEKKVIDTFVKYKKDLNSFDKIFEYLWTNVSNMQSKNKPSSLAPQRKYMPQTDAKDLTPEKFGESLGNVDQM